MLIIFVKIIIAVFISSCLSSTDAVCNRPFEGFGVHLGQLKSLNKTDLATQKLLLDTLYYDLGLRLLRTEYVSSFSRRENEYKIDCIDSQSCTWITMHHLVSHYPDFNLFASIWSPPHYMKDSLHRLRTSYEQKYLYFLKNITAIIKKDYGLTIGPISLINEPENVFAPWEHTVMGPRQMCRLAEMLDDESLKVCPENSYFWITKVYLGYRDLFTNCYSSCNIIATHGYYLNTNLLSSNRGQVYYDTGVNRHSYEKPIWMTEICSTLPNTINSIQEAIDLSASIVNFVGSTCVTRFYYWLAFTTFPSGESLIWLNQPDKVLFDKNLNKPSFIFPKKYWAYRHFSRASFPGNNRIRLCSREDYLCLQFDDNIVFINNDRNRSIPLDQPLPLCCTTKQFDWKCDQTNGILPPKSICSYNVKFHKIQQHYDFL